MENKEVNTTLSLLKGCAKRRYSCTPSYVEECYGKVIDYINSLEQQLKAKDKALNEERDRISKLNTILSTSTAKNNQISQNKIQKKTLITGKVGKGKHIYLKPSNFKCEMEKKVKGKIIWIDPSSE